MLLIPYPCTQSIVALHGQEAGNVSAALGAFLLLRCCGAFFVPPADASAPGKPANRETDLEPSVASRVPDAERSRRRWLPAFGGVSSGCNSAADRTALPGRDLNGTSKLRCCRGDHIRRKTGADNRGDGIGLAPEGRTWWRLNGEGFEDSDGAATSIEASSGAICQKEEVVGC